MTNFQESNTLTTDLGDGLDDFVCIGSAGDAYVSINDGFSDGVVDGPPSFTSLGGTYKTAEGVQDRVRLADIDGDGRFDYCAIADDGDISCWRNGGQGDEADYWQALGVVFTGKNKGDIDGVMFADLNGDVRIHSRRVLGFALTYEIEPQ
jgi:hypothetical protein